VKKVFVATPVYREIPVDFATRWLNLAQARDLPFGIVGEFLPGESLVSRARNRLTADFLESDCTHLLQIDADILFSLDSVKRICSHDEAIVGGLCPLKLDREFLFAAKALPGVFGPDSRGLLPVRYVGAGFLLVRRYVFEKMITASSDEISYRADRIGRTEHDFWQVGVYRPGPGQPARYMSEDWGFLQRVLDPASRCLPILK